MKNELLVASALLAGSPGIVMYLLGTNALIQLLGLVIIILGILMIPIGLLTKGGGGETKLPWFALGFTLVVLILAEGYIPTAGGFSLGFAPSLTILVGFAVVLVEIGMIFSRMFGNYKMYSTELKKAGYDEEEFNLELRSFNRFMELFILASFGASIGVYFLFEILPLVRIDILSALLITALVYFVIARYVLSHRKQKM